MKPAISPLSTAALAAAFTLIALPGLPSAQPSTTFTEQTVTESTVTRTTPPPKEIVTTEIEFQPASTAHDLNVQMLRDFENVKQSDPGIGSDIARRPELVENDGYVRRHPALQAFLARHPNARNEIIDSPGNFVTPVAESRWNSHEVAGIPRDGTPSYSRHASSTSMRNRVDRGLDAAAPADSMVVAEEGSTVVEKHGNTTTELEFKPAATAHDLNVQMLRDFEAVKAGDPSVGTEIAKNPARVQDAAFVGKHPALQAFLAKYPGASHEIVSSPGNFVTPVAGSTWNSHEAAGIPRN
jgi:hypothetical protein